MGTMNESRLDSFFQTMLNELDVDYKDEATAFSADRLRQRARKRAMYIKPALNDEGLDKFIQMNESLLSTSVTLDSDIVSNAKYFITNIFERFNSSQYEDNIQEVLDWRYLETKWKFGPGASHGISGTHTSEKISQKMTCTSSCEPLVVNIRRSNPYFAAFDAVNGGGTILYNGSKLTTVPKNEDTVRIIAIEPSGNMALQLAAGQYITDVLKTIGLDITSQQPKNKRLAELASSYNHLATIDLKSASDMFKPELIRQLLPEEWFDLLMKIRSPATLIRGEWVELNMISTMGNGFTFPLMTLCLCSLIYALRCRHNGPNLYIDWTYTAVFGDDIIIPTHEYVEYTSLLASAGLVVNHDKSYCDGPFRESCGGDYYKGVDVTPFYVRSLSTDPEIFVAINQVLLWSASRNIFLPKTLALLGSWLRTVLLVPEWSNPDQGILTSQVPKRYKFLQPVQHKVKLLNEHFLMPLAIGGYVTSDGPDVYYLPRQFKTRYAVRRGRLPNSFLSGRDPLKRVASTSALIDFFVSLMFVEH